MIELIDTHCHLHFPSFGLDPAQSLADARLAGVNKVICVGCSLNDSEQAIRLAAKHSEVWATAGVHPHNAADFLAAGQAGLQLTELLNQPKVVAVGEIGLDYYRLHAPKIEQEKALRLQLEIGQHSNLPFIFHVREAWEGFWPIFDDYRGISGVIHSFSAHPRQLKEALARNLYVALNGIVTFTPDPLLIEAVKQIPLERLLLETDAPFLTPKPFRGKICEPKHVRTTAEFLADLRGESLETLAKSSASNALGLFNLHN